MSKGATIYSSVSTIVIYRTGDHVLIDISTVVPYILQDIQRVMSSWGSAGSMIDPFTHVPAVCGFSAFFLDKSYLTHRMFSS